jgi:hypothetical protein
MSDALPAPPAGTTFRRALPGILLIAVVSLAPLWGVLAQGWSVLAVVFVYVADGVADGLTFWLRARRAQGAVSDEEAKDRVLVSEFVRTYFVVVAAMVIVLYMVFSGRLLKPGGGVPEDVFQAFSTGQFGLVVAGFVAVRWFIYWWDWVRGGEAEFMPPAGVVAAPLRRLFVLQFGVLVGGPSTAGPWVRPPPRWSSSSSSSRRRKWRWPCTSACARRVSAPPSRQA